MLDRRKKLTIKEYENIFNKALMDPEDGVELVSDEENGNWYFAGTKNHVRQYKQK
jgi:hydroxymethylglutaryl-CoA synthase